MSPQICILLVDDETSILKTLGLVLQKQGYRVITAASAAAALQMLGNGSHCDVVITDLNMEEEDSGLEVARFAQRLNPRPAIIICTGYASIANSRAALDLGVDYMAHKPMNLPELIAALNRLVAKKGSLGAP